MMNNVGAAVLLVLASVGMLMLMHPGYLAGGLGAGVGASIVRARGPSRLGEDARLCLGAAYVASAVVMLSLGGAPSFMFVFAYPLVPSLLYGSAALLFARSS